jgi:hypothetical protein
MVGQALAGAALVLALSGAASAVSPDRCSADEPKRKIVELGELAFRAEEGCDGREGDAEATRAGERIWTAQIDDRNQSDFTRSTLSEVLADLVTRNMVPALDEMTPRPWCDAGALNPTERAVCSDRNLSRLDALLQLFYGAIRARDDDRAQLAWLREERDACGTDRPCIASAYAARLDQLNQEVIPAPAE